MHLLMVLFIMESELNRDMSEIPHPSVEETIVNLFLNRANKVKEIKFISFILIILILY